MSFITNQYFIFLCTVAILYFSLPQKLRWVLLLASSYYFYACWKVEFLLLIIFSTFIDYICALKIQECRSDSNNKKLVFLLISLIMNLGLLFTFKYSDFFITNTNLLFKNFNLLYQIPHLNLLLPVGISFYTFQTLSYTIDVYQGKRDAERHLGIFALYVSFFPQLVAGPIERSTHLMPQFFENHRVDFERIRSGLRLILWGIFKKVVIADYIAVFVNKVYENPSNFNAVFLLLATYFFAFQIYCDFSGYSDIAIGSARILGYDLMQNFDNPYFATSIKGFWKRWHISLTSWFKDYIYLPLGGQRTSQVQWVFNIFIVFLISGIWHGANWTFVAWGALHGFLYLLIEYINKLFFGKKRDHSKKENLFNQVFNALLTFNFVAVTWIFFRAKTLTEALIIVKRIIATPLTSYYEQVKMFVLSLKNIFISWHFNVQLGLFLILSLMIIDYIKNKPTFLDQNTILVKIGRYIVYSIALVLIFLFYNFSKEDFIYFQF